MDQQNSPQRPQLQYQLQGLVRELLMERAQIMCALRDKWLSRNPHDPANQWGALYGEVQPDTLMQRHHNNPLSRFTIATTNNGELVGYTRYTLPNLPSTQSELILIVVDPSQRKSANSKESIPLSSLLMERTLADMKSAGAQSVIADIASYPVNNEASVRLHQSHGFQFSGPGTPIPQYIHGMGAVRIEFRRFQKELN